MTMRTRKIQVARSISRLAMTCLGMESRASVPPVPPVPPPTTTYGLTLSDDPHPSRYLVLDFSDVLPGPGGCPGLDTEIKGGPNNGYGNLVPYGTRHPTATSHEDPAQNPCIDFVEVRFVAENAFNSLADFSTVSMRIDAPDGREGKGKDKGTITGVIWQAKFELAFVNPLTITRDTSDPDIVTLTTVGDAEAQL